MSTDHHTPITYNAAADAAIFNAPLAELDAAINVEHEIDGTHSPNIIDQAEILLTTAAAAIRKAIRYDEFTAQHLAAGGHRTDVEIITAQAQVNLGTAAVASGDAVRFNEYNAHNHTISVPDTIYTDATQSAAADTNTAALPIYIRTDNNSNEVIFVRIGFYKESYISTLILIGRWRNTSASLTGRIRFVASGGGLTPDITDDIAPSTGWTDFKLNLDISAMADNITCEVYIQLSYPAGAGGATGQLELTRVNILSQKALNSGAP